MIIAIDLEGILIPEIWERIAEETGIHELRLTTRDIPDFRKLMEHRVNILAQHNLRLSDITKIAHKVEPFLAAKPFLHWAHKQAQVMIISDTFYELASGIVEKLDHFNLFANRFIVDSKGFIKGCDFRIRGKKERIIQSLKDIGFYVIGIGDSFNDLSLLRSCSYPILYNTPDKITAKFPNAPRVTNLDDLKTAISIAIKNHEREYNCRH